MLYILSKVNLKFFGKVKTLIYYFFQHVFIEHPLSARGYLGVLRIQKQKHRQAPGVTKCTISKASKCRYLFTNEGQRDVVKLHLYKVTLGSPCVGCMG